MDRRRELTLILLAMAAWAVGRPYAGLVHDSRLYGLQGIARLGPDSLGQDLFLRFGSQDAFTVFSPFYAAAIGLFGIEHAARLLTLLGQAWWFFAIAMLATGLLGRQRGLLAVALVAALPGYYGAWDVFRYAEPFLTPRLLSEASVMTGLALLVRGHRTLAAAAMLSGMAFHPLMGLAGVLALIGVSLPSRSSWMLAATVMAGTLLAVAWASLAPMYPLVVFDEEWLSLARMRSPFLSMSDWNEASWSRVLVPLTTLWALGYAMREQPGRSLFLAAAMVGFLGLAVTLIGATLTPVVLITQGQAWRWTWIACAVLAIAAVQSAPTLWRAGHSQRSGLALLGLAWILTGWPAIASAVIGAAAVVAGKRLREGWARRAELTAWALVCAGIYVWLSSLTWPFAAGAGSNQEISTLRALQHFTADGTLPVVAILAIWWLGQRDKYKTPTLVAAAVLVLGTLAAVGPAWLRSDFDRPDGAAVREWRRVIPTNSEVFWPDNPAASWFMLGRRSYVSAEQTAGILFSRDALRETVRRVEEVKLVLPPAFAFGAAAQGRTWPITDDSLALICQRSKADFIVSRTALSWPAAAPPLTVADQSVRSSYPVFLYRCADIRPDETFSDHPAGSLR